MMKLANTAIKRTPAIATGPAIWSVLRLICCNNLQGGTKPTKAAGITFLDHGDTFLINDPTIDLSGN